MIPWIRAKNVLVLIPPPVDPGEAPINIKTIKTISPGVVNSFSGYVENPAVLAETLLKKAPIQEIFSVSFKRSVPDSRSPAVTVRTIYVCMENFFQRNLVDQISRITRKPIPPQIINPHVTMFNRTSF